MARSFAQQRAANAQSMARSLARDAKLQAREAAERNRRLYADGELFELVGVHEAEREVKAGMLLSCFQDLANKPAIRERYRESGARFLAPKEDNREAVVVVFREGVTITRQIAAALREVGLRENRIRREWEGRVEFTAAKAEVEAAGGTIRRLASGAHQEVLREAAE